MERRRILFVSHSGAVSGAEAVLLDLARPMIGASAFIFENGPLADRMKAAGIPVTVSRFADGISVVRRDAAIWKALPLAGRLLRICAEITRAARRHRLIYANSQKAFALSAPAAVIARRPLIWHLHDIPDPKHFGRAQLVLQIFLANRFASRVIVPSEAVRQAFVAAGGDPGRVRVVPNGVTWGRVDARPKHDLRLSLGLPEGPLVGVFSRLAAWKGQHVVIEALSRLPDVRCAIIGSALFGETAYAEELKALTERLGLGERIVFLGQRSDVPDLMRAVDIVVHPSVLPEPFGLTVVEGMLAERPVVASAAGAIPEILEGGKAGWLVPPADPEAMALAIREILSEPAAVARKTAYARQRAERFYSTEQMVARVCDVISEVAQEQPADGRQAA